jgi:hypothetical protein
MSTGFLVDTSVVSWYLDRHARARHPSLVTWLDVKVMVRNPLIFQQFTTALRCIVETFEAEGLGFDSLRARCS